MKQVKLILRPSPGVAVHTCNSSTQEAEAGGSRALGQPGLHSGNLSQKNKQSKTERYFI
jgi:hypothetical protein